MTKSKDRIQKDLVKIYLISKLSENFMVISRSHIMKLLQFTITVVPHDHKTFTRHSNKLTIFQGHINLLEKKEKSRTVYNRTNNIPRRYYIRKILLIVSQLFSILQFQLKF